MPNGWKKNNFAFGHKIALCGGGSFTFCRCDRCCKSLNRAKANIDVVDTASGGKLASRSRMMHIQHAKCTGANSSSDEDVTKRDRGRGRIDLKRYAETSILL